MAKIIKEEILIGNYVLAGEPVPWARASYVRGHFYDTQKAIKSVLRGQVLEQHNNRRLFLGPLEMNITFVLLPPQVTKDKKSRIDAYHHTRPDLDNMAKILLDLCSGILYKDDCQISQMFKKKIYGTEARTEFTIKELE